MLLGWSVNKIMENLNKKLIFLWQKLTLVECIYFFIEKSREFAKR
jgi:hypothetical protein